MRAPMPWPCTGGLSGGTPGGIAGWSVRLIERLLWIRCFAADYGTIVLPAAIIWRLGVTAPLRCACGVDARGPCTSYPSPRPKSGLPDFGTRRRIEIGYSRFRWRGEVKGYSTVTDFARLRGWSTSVPMMTAVW